MTYLEHIVDEIRCNGPLTGLTFHARMQRRPLTFWQRVYMRLSSPYVDMARLEDQGLLVGYREPRPPWHDRLLYRLRTEKDARN